ncbi:MAG: hypothetical protein ACTSYI_10675 [Promethearchaeota archaeon]
MNSIIETEYEYILKISIATTFPIDSIPNWYLMRNKNSLKIGNVKPKKGSASTSQNFIKINRKYFYTYHKVEDGFIFLSKESNRFRFESMKHRRFLQANKIMSWKQKSPNRTYTLNLEDKFDTDGHVSVLSSQTHGNLKPKRVQISKATYVLLYSPYRWALYSRISPLDLTLPRINTRDVCGICSNFNHQTSQCRNVSHGVLYCTSACTKFSLRSTLIEPEEEFTPIYQPHLWAIGV